ncbi:MAG TPA: hypothetical protein VGQ00_04480 [Candidatus Norongarragalinales archaeon]|nr:hypothetical protein [Candidatus Norongarragalinales archaeon]
MPEKREERKVSRRKLLSLAAKIAAGAFMGAVALGAAGQHRARAAEAAPQAVSGTAAMAEAKPPLQVHINFGTHASPKQAGLWLESAIKETKPHAVLIEDPTGNANKETAFQGLLLQAASGKQPKSDDPIKNEAAKIIAKAIAQPGTSLDFTGLSEKHEGGEGDEAEEDFKKSTKLMSETIRQVLEKANLRKALEISNERMEFEKTLNEKRAKAIAQRIIDARDQLLQGNADLKNAGAIRILLKLSPKLAAQINTIGNELKEKTGEKITTTSHNEHEPYSLQPLDLVDDLPKTTQQTSQEETDNAHVRALIAYAYASLMIKTGPPAAGEDLNLYFEMLLATADRVLQSPKSREKGVKASDLDLWDTMREQQENNPEKTLTAFLAAKGFPIPQNPAEVEGLIKKHALRIRLNHNDITNTITPD